LQPKAGIYYGKCIGDTLLGSRLIFACNKPWVCKGDISQSLAVAYINLLIWQARRGLWHGIHNRRNYRRTQSWRKAGSERPSQCYVAKVFCLDTFSTIRLLV